MADSGPSRIAASASLEAGAAIPFRGRVLERIDDSILIADASGRALARCTDALPVGALIEGEVVRAANGTLSVRGVRVHTTPASGALHADGDVRRLLGGPGRLARLQRRSDALRAVRAQFSAGAYVEVETPTLVPNPGMDVHLDAFRVDGTAQARYLATSPEYAMKRLVAAGLERIFQVTRSYRRDEAGSVHEPEFTIVEWYRAYAGADVVMAETERLAAAVVAACNAGRTTVVRGGSALDLAPGWPRMTVREAVRVHADRDLDALLDDEEELFRVLSFEVQPKLGHGRPVWLVDWPIALASLARPSPADPSVAERFEAYAQGIELCNGFAELTDPVEQRRRFEADLRARVALGKPAYPLDERFLAALEDGMPECAGNALGFDRLVMIATAATDIDDVCAIGSRRIG